MEAAPGVHQEPNGTVALDAGTNGRIIVTTTCTNIVLRTHEQFRHRLGSQIPGHRKVSDIVPAEIRNFPRTISLMPICGYQDPAVTSNLRKECLVGRSDISGDILLVNPVADTGSVELV